jgi:hypothetical protein
MYPKLNSQPCVYRTWYKIAKVSIIAEEFQPFYAPGYQYPITSPFVMDYGLLDSIDISEASQPKDFPSAKYYTYRRISV